MSTADKRPLKNKAIDIARYAFAFLVSQETPNAQNYGLHPFEAWFRNKKVSWRKKKRM